MLLFDVFEARDLAMTASFPKHQFFTTGPSPDFWPDGVVVKAIQVATFTDLL